MPNTEKRLKKHGLNEYAEGISTDARNKSGKNVIILKRESLDMEVGLQL